MKEKINALKDQVWNGVAIGILAPILPLMLSWYAMHHVQALKNAHLLIIACIAINAVLMNYFFKQNKDNIARGIISITFLWA